MRTTVTLDSDVAERIKALAHERQTSFKETLNDVLRRGLRAPASQKRPGRFVVRAHSGGFRPGIDPERLNQLLDELAVETFIDRAAILA